MGQIGLLPIQIIALAVWFGLAIYGVLRLTAMGYRTRAMRISAFYVLPVVVIAYLALEFLQPIDTDWPANLPSIIVNLVLAVLFCYISPVLLAATYVYPNKKEVEPTVLVVRQARFERYRGWFIFGAFLFIGVLVPLIAQFMYPDQLDGDRVLTRVAPGYDLVLGTLVNGLLTGSLISLVALGYTLVYGIVELINFAHGDVFMIGSLTGFGVMSLLLGAKSSRAINGVAIPWIIIVIIIALIASMAVCAFLNYMIDRLAYRRLRNAPRLAPLITAIGVSFILQNVGQYIIGASPQGYPMLFPNQTSTATIEVFSDIFGNDKLLFQFPITAFLVIISVAGLLVGMRYLINSTKIGKAMRAVAQNSEAAALMGININRTISAAFLIGGGLAGAAGVIYGIYNIQSTVRYDLGFENGLFAFTAAVLGGIGNINGAVLGGFFIGMIYSVSQSDLFGLTSDLFGPSSHLHLSLSIWAPVSVFGVLVLVMVFRPSGILGENVPEKV
jgi:branched-chain amino acid transport system permease protein